MIFTPALARMKEKQNKTFDAHSVVEIADSDNEEQAKTLEAMLCARAKTKQIRKTKRKERSSNCLPQSSQRTQKQDQTATKTGRRKRGGGEKRNSAGPNFSRPKKE